MKKRLFLTTLLSREVLFGLLLVSLFVMASLLAQEYSETLQSLTSISGIEGIISYIFLVIVAVVVAPITTLPLIPVFALVWGVLLTALFSIVGWAIGSAIAFILARRLGKPFVIKIMALEKIQKIENLIPKRHIFLSIVLLRMAVPVDILSYGLGLFSSISFKLYMSATIIGIIPFAFIFSYASTFPTWIQILAGVGSIIVLMTGYNRCLNRLTEM